MLKLLEEIEYTAEQCGGTLAMRACMGSGQLAYPKAYHIRGGLTKINGLSVSIRIIRCLQHRYCSCLFSIFKKQHEH